MGLVGWIFPDDARWSLFGLVGLPDEQMVSVGAVLVALLEVGSRFAVREGGKTVGSGVVAEVMD
jgi:translation elongation factor EF-Tu-like GTPase